MKEVALEDMLRILIHFDAFHFSWILMHLEDISEGFKIEPLVIVIGVDTAENGLQRTVRLHTYVSSTLCP